MEFNEWFKSVPGKPSVDNHVGLVLFARKWAALGWNAALKSKEAPAIPPTTASTQAGECDQHDAGHTCSYEPDSGKCGEEPCKD